MMTLDDLGRRAAAALRTDAEVLAGPERQRTPHLVPAVVIAPPHGDRRWAALAAAALVTAVVGAVVWARGGDDTAVTDTVSTPVPTLAATTVSTTPDPVRGPVETASPETVQPATSPPTVTADAATVSPGGAVSYLDPPPALRLRELASLPIVLDPLALGPPIAVLADGAVAIFDGARNVVVVVDAAGREREVALDDAALPAGIFNLVGGPDDVLYAIDGQQSTAPPLGMTRVVAIPLNGDDAGRVVAEQPISLTAGLTEVGPGGQIGQGPTGIIDRQSGEIAIPYVGGAVLDGINAYAYDDATTTVRRDDGSIAWAFDIERVATAIDSYTGDVPPAPTADGGARLWTAIGPYEEAEGDFPPPTVPVLAFLWPDGSVEWNSIPDGWQVASSDLGGTLLARRDATGVRIARADPAGASVTVGRGASIEAANCTIAACAHLSVELHGFPPGDHQVDCFSSEGGRFDTGTSTVAESGGQVSCYFGDSGATVWVHVGGVRSDDLVW